MANRQRAEARRKAAAKAARRSGEGGSKLWIWISGAVVAALVVVLVVALAGGGDDESEADGGSDTTTAVDSNVPDSQPVTVSGDALAPFAQTQGDEAIGVAAPVLKGLDFQGDEVVVDGATNGPTMVVFLAHWCPHCNAEMPRLLDWKNSGLIPAELNIVGVATAASESSVNYPPHRWFSQKGWSWPILVDEMTTEGAAGKAAQAYGATGWPYFVIVGADGTVKVRYSGEIEVADLQALVEEALAS